MTLLPRTLLLPAALLLLAAACRPGGDEAPSTPTPAAESPTEREAEPEGTSCAPTSARELIEGLALEDEASGCTIYLPLDPVAGTLTVRVSGAGAEDQAAVEWSEGGQRVFADRGEVEISSVEGDRLTGSVRAEASAGSQVQRATGEFSVTLATSP